MQKWGDRINPRSIKRKQDSNPSPHDKFPNSANIRTFAGNKTGMYHRKLYWKMTGAVASIVLLSLLGAGLFITKFSYTLSAGCLAVILLITLWIIRLVTKSNQRLSLFFNALENGDVSHHFPVTTDDPFLRTLYARMNRITQLFSESRAEVEQKSVYYESILRVLTHEFRNSITPVHSLSADLLAHSDHYTPAQLKEGLEVIHSQMKNLHTFLDSYHRLIHLPDPERQTIEVQPLFEKLQRLLGAESESNRIHYTLHTPVQLHADPNLIVLALLNLLRNALQAIARQTDGYIHVEAGYHSSHPYITVTDNGPGIAPDQLSVIFTPFFTTKTGGSGIGLSLSQRIMQLHEGRITVSSVPHQQTTFTLTF